MNQYDKIIEYGKANHGKHPQQKKGDKISTAMAKAFQTLAENKRKQLNNVKNATPLSKDRDEELAKVFGPDWYKSKRQSWKKEEDQLNWLKDFISSKNLSAEDWYRIQDDDFKNGGLGLIDKYNNSVKHLLDSFGSRLYPGYVWYEWKFGRVITWGIPYRDEYKIDSDNTKKYEVFKEKITKGESLSKEDIPLFRQFMDYVMEQEKLVDIHSLTHGLLLKWNGAGLVGRGLSFKTILTLAYPERTVHKFLLHPIRHEFWNEDTNLRSAFEYYCAQNDVPIEKLASISKQHVVDFGGWYGLKKIKENGAWIQLLNRAFPEMDWDPFQVSRINWTMENKKIVLGLIAQNEGWTEMEDYYNLTISLAESYKLNKLLMHYHNSPITLLRDLKSEYDWKEWKFSKSNQCWGNGTEPNVERIRAFFDEFKTTEQFESLNDFTKYIVKDFPQGIFQYYNFNLFKCMSQIYPEHAWNEDEFQAVNYSKVSMAAWKDLEKNDPRLKIQHKLNGGEVRVGKYPVDGHHTSLIYEEVLEILDNVPSFCNVYKHSTSTSIAFQFQGTYWHGHPDFYNASDIHPKSKKTYGELYQKTCETISELSKTHHVVEIWEHDYNKY